MSASTLDKYNGIQDVVGEKNLTSEFWMRTISFSGLHKILHLVASCKGGMTSRQVDALIVSSNAYLTKAGNVPSRSTLYHARNTLIRLNACTLSGQPTQMVANTRDERVARLLDIPATKHLDPIAKETFADLVLLNPECRRLFFDLFMPNIACYDLSMFREFARPVSWHLTGRGMTKKGSSFSQAVIESDGDNGCVTLKSESAINAILFGVRYWALDELQIIDEVHKGRGQLTLFSLTQDSGLQPGEIVSEILESLRGDEWTTLSIADLITRYCIQQHRSVDSLMKAIRILYSKYNDYIVLIPTARAFAALNLHRSQEQLMLRSYFQDRQGRYISHLRIHSTVQEAALDV